MVVATPVVPARSTTPSTTRRRGLGERPDRDPVVDGGPLERRHGRSPGGARPCRRQALVGRGERAPPEPGVLVLLIDDLRPGRNPARTSGPGGRSPGAPRTGRRIAAIRGDAKRWRPRCRGAGAATTAAPATPPHHQAEIHGSPVTVAVTSTINTSTIRRSSPITPPFNVVSISGQSDGRHTRTSTPASCSDPITSRWPATSGPGRS